jgi:Uma2 family endonuclease
MATVTRNKKPKATEEAPPGRLRFDVDDYHRLGALGFFKPDERVELIDGDIVPMSPVGPPHNADVARLTILLAERLGRRVVMYVQGSIRLNRFSEPQPDVSLMRPRADFYNKAHPSPKDVLMVIEVMQTSARYDRGYKLGLYARARIAEVWLVDLKRDRVETYRNPAKGVYRESQVHARGHTAAPLAFPDVSIAVDDILGPGEGKR